MQRDQGISSGRKATPAISQTMGSTSACHVWQPRASSVGTSDRGGHQSSLIIYSLLEILVLKFPKHHELNAWLWQSCVPKESYHTFSCIAQTKATNKCLSPLPWPLWLLLHLYLSPSPSFGFIPSWVRLQSMTCASGLTVVVTGCKMERPMSCPQSRGRPMR